MTFIRLYNIFILLIFDDPNCFSLMINDTLPKMKLLRGLVSRKVSTNSGFFLLLFLFVLFSVGENFNPPKDSVDVFRKRERSMYLMLLYRSLQKTANNQVYLFSIKNTAKTRITRDLGPHKLYAKKGKYSLLTFERERLSMYLFFYFRKVKVKKITCVWK